MARTMGRRSGNQQGRRRDEEYGRDDASPSRTPSDNRQQDTDSLIADMAKGFVEAQAKIAAAPADSSNREMMDLLEKISRQLAQMQDLSGAGQGQGRQQQTSDARENESSQQSQSGGQQGKGGQADLSAIFSRLLSAEKQENTAQQSGSGQSGDSQGQGGQQSRAGSGQQRQGGSQQQGGQSTGSQSITAQTAAQALAQAQYELANELEASLSKLKQVISESERLADRISNLLGQEGGSRQT